MPELLFHFCMSQKKKIEKGDNMSEFWGGGGGQLSQTKFFNISQKYYGGRQVILHLGYTS